MKMKVLEPSVVGNVDENANLEKNVSTIPRFN